MKCTGVAGSAFPDGKIYRRNPVISVVISLRQLMIARNLILLLTLAATPSLYGQSESIVERESDAVEIASSIRHIVFVYHQSTIGKSQPPTNDLEKLEHPAVAVKKAKPSTAISELIDSLCHGNKQNYSLYSATAIDYGDKGFFWKIEWLLSPAEGGSSGPPTPHYSIVRGDGTVVRPSIFLCDTFGSPYDENNDQLFSVLALDDVLPALSDAPSDNDLKSAAIRSLENAASNNNLKYRFQFDSIEKYEFSGKLNSIKDLDGKLAVWAVRFLDTDKPRFVDPDSPNCLTVWVTIDLTTSRISVGEWDPANKRQIAK